MKIFYKILSLALIVLTLSVDAFPVSYCVTTHDVYFLECPANTHSQPAQCSCTLENQPSGDVATNECPTTKVQSCCESLRLSYIDVDKHDFELVYGAKLSAVLASFICVDEIVDSHIFARFHHPITGPPLYIRHQALLC